MNFPTPTRKDYTFLGWSYNGRRVGTGANEVDFLNTTLATGTQYTLTAEWGINKASATFSPGELDDTDKASNAALPEASRVSILGSMALNGGSAVSLEDVPGDASFDSLVEGAYHYRGHAAAKWKVTSGDTDGGAPLFEKGDCATVDEAVRYALSATNPALPQTRAVTIEPVWERASYTVSFSPTDDKGNAVEYTILTTNDDGTTTAHRIGGPSAEDFTESYTYLESTGSFAYSAPFRDRVFREGYVFMGWKDATDYTDEQIYPPNINSASANSFKGYVNDTQTNAGTYNIGAWGDKTLVPVFRVKTYTVFYEPGANKANGDDSGSRLVLGDDGKPAAPAVAYNAEGAGAGLEMYKDHYYTSYDYPALNDGSAKLARTENVKGYTFGGWVAASQCQSTMLSLGVKPDGAATFDALTNDKTGGKTNVRTLLWPNDDGTTTQVGSGTAVNYTSANAQPTPAFVYVYWHSAQTYKVTLGKNEPVWMTGGDGATATADGEQVSSAGGGEFFWWPDNGITNKADDLNERDVAGTQGSSAGDLIVAGSTADTTGNGLAMVAPTREGFQFRGWGLAAGEHAELKHATVGAGGSVATSSVANNDPVDEHPASPAVTDGNGGEIQPEGKDCAGEPDGFEDKFALYISYDEGTGKFSLTETGAAVLAAWNSGLDNNNEPVADGLGMPDAEEGVTWVAVWEARQYDVVLRIPMNAVKKVDGTKWRNVQDASQGWWRAVRKLHYWDEVVVPAYEPVDNSFTFAGWNTRQTAVGSTSDPKSDAYGDYQVAAGAPGSKLVRGTDTADKSAQDYTWSARYGAGRDVDGSAAETLRATKEIADGGEPFGSDAGSGRAQDRQMWLRYKVIQIGVDAPVAALYLCSDTTDGKPKSDKNDYLEDAYAVGTDGRRLLESRIDITTATTAYGTSHDLVVDSVTCTVDGTTAAGGEYLAGDLLTVTDNSRCFWLATDDTVTPVKNDNWWTSQDTSAQTLELGDGSGRAKGKRNYFGFGATPGDNTLSQAPVAASASDEAGAAVYDVDEAAGRVDLSGFVVGMPGSSAGTPGTYVDLDKDGNPTADKSKIVTRKTTFYYGLDLNRATIGLANAQKVFEKGIKDTEVPLAKLTFTFQLA